MANTDSRNFRCHQDNWNAAQAKAQKMRDAGYDIDVTKVLNVAVTAFNDETIAATARRLGLKKRPAPVNIYRRPTARSEQ